MKRTSSKIKRRDTRPHVVIVGGGFGGLYAAKELRKAPVRITLVDRRNHHLFQPLLYQVATGGVSPADIAEPIRTVLRNQDNLKVVMDEAERVDLEARELVLSGRRLKYDYLILAAGVTNNYFGNDAWEEDAPGLKTLEDALTIRRRFLLAFEKAEVCDDPAERKRMLTSVIIGAGPTGVELAGTMSEMGRKSLPRSYSNIDPGDAHVILVEGSPRVLKAYSEELSESAKRQLEDRDVEVIVDAMVERLERNAVWLSNGRKIACGNIFWGAGIRGEPITKTLGVPLDRADRVKVEFDCSLPGHPEVFAVGDCATLTDASGTWVPGVAQGAIQMGQYAARVIRDGRLKDRPTPPFVYNDKGSLATIGRAAAVGYVGSLELSGFPAWLLWLFIHIFFLIGFDNQLLVLLQWGWSYFTYKRGAQLITKAHREDESFEAHPESEVADAQAAAAS